MKIKDEIRQRRRDRIRNLIGEQQAKPAIPPSNNSNQEVDKPSPAKMNSSREPDPEKVWKQKSHRWHDWGKDSSASGSDGRNTSGRMGPDNFKSEIQIKLVISLFVFGAVWGMFQTDMPWARYGQSFVHDVLTNDMNFEAAAAWYQETFAGSPAFIPIFGSKEQTAERADGTVRLPVVVPVKNGVIVHTFAELLNGVEVAASSEADVSAVETGRVLLVSDAENEGKTIVIQHANRRVTVYGKLGQSHVKPNEWVEAGQTIGNLKMAENSGMSMLFFAVKENNQYVDPMDVVPFD